MIRFTGFIGLMAIAALSLRISLTNAFVYANWADAESYALGAGRVYAGMTPYSDFQLAGPYGLDDAANGLGLRLSAEWRVPPLCRSPWARRSGTPGTWSASSR